jgi:aerobic C4-dicarboxylate transport protein
LILGIDRFMSEARAITNVIGNGVATIVVARWTGDLDREALDRQLTGRLSRYAEAANSGTTDEHRYTQIKT